MKRKHRRRKMSTEICTPIYHLEETHLDDSIQMLLEASGEVRYGEMHKYYPCSQTDSNVLKL